MEFLELFQGGTWRADGDHSDLTRDPPRSEATKIRRSGILRDRAYFVKVTPAAD